MIEYLAKIWKCRYFWVALVQMDLRTRYRRSVLGLGWSLLNPLLMTAVLCLVFPRLFHLEVREYAPLLIVGLCLWNFVTTVTIHGCSCFFQGEKYIRQYPTPLAIYPLRTMLGTSFHMLMGLLVALLTRFVLLGFDNLPALPAAIPGLLLLAITGWSLAVMAGLANTYFPDTQNLLEVGFQILFYATPIIYPAALLKDRGLDALMHLNPLVTLIELIRLPLVSGTIPPASLYLGGCAITLVCVFSAMALLQRAHNRLIFQL